MTYYEFAQQIIDELPVKWLRAPEYTALDWFETPYPLEPWAARLREPARVAVRAKGGDTYVKTVSAYHLAWDIAGAEMAGSPDDRVPD